MQALHSVGLHPGFTPLLETPGTGHQSVAVTGSGTLSSGRRPITEALADLCMCGGQSVALGIESNQHSCGSNGR